MVSGVACGDWDLEIRKIVAVWAHIKAELTRLKFISSNVDRK